MTNCDRPMTESLQKLYFGMYLHLLQPSQPIAKSLPLMGWTFHLNTLHTYTDSESCIDVHRLSINVLYLLPSSASVHCVGGAHNNGQYGQLSPSRKSSEIARGSGGILEKYNVNANALEADNNVKKAKDQRQ